MATKDELLKARFLLNMDRIRRMVQLLSSNETLTPTYVFRSEGVRADMLRSIVVFLHATFEVALRSQVRKPGEHLNFYSSADIDKALKRSNVDAQPFKPLYPPLTQMAKRRNRIVHSADLSERTGTSVEAWGIVDDWQLIMWLLAVPAFYYRLRMSVNAASEVERTMYERLRNAMRNHVDLGNELRAFPDVPAELQREALQKMLTTLESLAAALRLDRKGLDPDLG